MRCETPLTQGGRSNIQTMVATDFKAAITQEALAIFPQLQAIYLFGSWETEDQWPDSDVDIAVLLPPAEAKKMGSLSMNPLRFSLESLLNRPVDLINLRQASTVLQKEVVCSERRFYCIDDYAADEFEMLALSYYQKLNEERREILHVFWQTGKAYPV
jgi:predicted nucleotidyltransferase